MKILNLRLFFITSFFTLLPLNMLAQKKSFDYGLYWERKDGTLIISGHGSMPNWKNKEDVPWYSEKDKIYKVLVEEGVSSIGEDAFWFHENIYEVILPNSVMKIGMGAFCGCHNLRQINLPLYLTEIESFSFSGCWHLHSIDIPKSVHSIGSHAFDDCSSLSSLVIPQGVTTIGEEAFSHNYRLTNVEISQSVQVIGKKAFSGSQNLKYVKGLHSGIQIAEDAFSYTPFFYYNIEAIKNKITTRIKSWQKKGEFETQAQYGARVTKENQQKETQKVIDEIISKYSKQDKIFVELGKYDADNEVFSIVIDNIEERLLKVPSSKAEKFKRDFNNYDKRKLTATYIVTNDGIKVNNLQVIVRGKKYPTIQNEEMQFASINNISLPIEIDFSSNTPTKEKTLNHPVVIDHSIDLDIPSISTHNKNSFAIIIGNEHYTRVAQVPFANNDARIFAEYCKKTLGLPAQNVKVYENATYGAMIGAVSDIQKITKAFKGDINVIFYYAGHGIPDEATGEGYLLPVDADGMNIRVCYPLSQLYKDLGSMKARSVTCFMDACFSGAQRGNGMVVAARGVAIKAKGDHPMGNTVVFTAATDKQTAYPYEEKGHGMFTYYLLKKLRETKGDCTLGELGSFICDEVAKQAIITNGKEQTPVVLTSGSAGESWRTMKLR